MKTLLTTLLMLLCFDCSTEVIDSWKNPDISSYSPTKVLVVGMTSNVEARTLYEKELKNELELRGIHAVMSQEFFNRTLLSEKISEFQMDNFEDTLLAEGFDTVLFTKVIGVEEKIRYNRVYDGDDETYKSFKDEYLMYQDLYYNPEYYEDYRLFHTETELYCICPAKKRELIWKGFVDITDPKISKLVVREYVNLLITRLEDEELINSMKNPNTF